MGVSLVFVWPNFATRHIEVYFLEELSQQEQEKKAQALIAYLAEHYPGRFQTELRQKARQSGEGQEIVLSIWGNFIQTAFLNELARQGGVDQARLSLEPLWVERHLKVRPFKLGLDLQGGMNLVLEADFEKLKEQLEKQYPPDDIKKWEEELTKEQNPEKKKELEAKLEEARRALDFSDERKRLDTEGALEIIRARIDRTGVSEPLIRLQGSDKIEIALPGVASPEQAKKIISSTARVEYRLAEPSQGGELGPYTQAANLRFEEYKQLKTDYQRQEFIKKLEKEIKLPKEYGIYVYMERRDSPENVSRAGLEMRYFMVLENEVALSGDMMSRNVYATFDPESLQNTVEFELTNEGRKRFAEITSKNRGRLLAILIDGVVRSAPRINEPITGGRARITGSFTPQEAKDLALIIREGALPVPMKIVEERSIGPTLGKEAIDTGFKAIIFGFTLVVAYMALYYHLAGIIANVALLLNLLFMAAIFSLMDFTITLPGLAGVVLTLGMAVDANVIIYERLREELARGHSLKKAVDASFERATKTILDSNLTTLISAVILSSKLGVGPIKGFGVTLFVGIITTLFTSLFVTKTVFFWLTYSLNVKSIAVGFGKYRLAQRGSAA
ncbi:MAG: protein translocase subunit SecD [Leptospiraceae bacterium]|nr:protein translocase subunit SecD [Leptospiraceae bacterium]